MKHPFILKLGAVVPFLYAKLILISETKASANFQPSVFLISTLMFYTTLATNLSSLVTFDVI